MLTDKTSDGNENEKDGLDDGEQVSESRAPFRREEDEKACDGVSSDGETFGLPVGGSMAGRFENVGGDYWKQDRNREGASVRRSRKAKSEEIRTHRCSWKTRRIE